MFTGIITDNGEILAIEGDKNGDKKLLIATSYPADGIDIGASIACNGICLTVTKKGMSDVAALPYYFEVVASQHTQNTTTLSLWSVGKKINLERALKLGDELGGHMVSGHVDGIAKLVARQSDSATDSCLFEVEPPHDLAPYIAEKGSVTLDGVSLTVAALDTKTNIFTLALIPHTMQVTNWGNIKAGDSLNIEIDIFARYLKRMQDFKL